MIRTRLSTFGALLAVAAISSTAGAQSYTFERPEAGVLAPTRNATTTHELLSSSGTVALPIVAQTANSSEKVDLVAESMPSDHWGAISLHESNVDADATDTDETKASEPGFFSSTTGRMSIVGIAGLAGASYFALRSNGAADNARFDPISPSTGFNAAADVIVNPEPASIALLALGLGALGLAARRRRTN